MKCIHCNGKFEATHEWISCGNKAVRTKQELMYCADCAAVAACEMSSSKLREHPVLCLEKHFAVVKRLSDKTIKKELRLKHGATIGASQ